MSIGDLVTRLIADGIAPELAASVVAEAYARGLAHAPAVPTQTARQARNSRYYERHKDDLKTKREARAIASEPSDTSRAQTMSDGQESDHRFPPDIPPSSPRTPHQPPFNPPTQNTTGDEPGADRCGSPKPAAPQTRPAKADPRGTFLPQGWSPLAADWAYALERLAAADLGEDAARNELEKFRDYWLARPGEGGRKRDWGATWRTWIRKAADDGKRSPTQFSGAIARSGSRPSGVHAVAAALAHRKARRDEWMGGEHSPQRTQRADDPGILDADWADARSA